MPANLGDSHLLQNGQWTPNPEYRPDITGVNSGRAPVPTAPGTGYTPAQSWFGQGVNPFQRDVWGGTVDESGAPSGRMQLDNGGSNPNYITPEAAQQIAKALGANLVRQTSPGGDYGPAGPISAPMFSLDFGYGAPVDVGSVVAGLNRGDALKDILARVQAGVGYGLNGRGETIPGNAGPSDWRTPVPGASYGGQKPEWPKEWRPTTSVAPPPPPAVPPPPPPPAVTPPPATVPQGPAGWRDKPNPNIITPANPLPTSQQPSVPLRSGATEGMTSSYSMPQQSWRMEGAETGREQPRQAAAQPTASYGAAPSQTATATRFGIPVSQESRGRIAPEGGPTPARRSGGDGQRGGYGSSPRSYQQPRVINSARSSILGAY